MTFDEFKTLAEEYGLQAVECCDTHWRLLGGKHKMNFWPTVGKFKDDKDGRMRHGDHIDAILLAGPPKVQDKPSVEPTPSVKMGKYGEPLTYDGDDTRGADGTLRISIADRIRRTNCANALCIDGESLDPEQAAMILRDILWAGDNGIDRNACAMRNWAARLRGGKIPFKDEWPNAPMKPEEDSERAENYLGVPSNGPYRVRIDYSIVGPTKVDTLRLTTTHDAQAAEAQMNAIYAAGFRAGRESKV